MAAGGLAAWGSEVGTVDAFARIDGGGGDGDGEESGELHGCVTLGMKVGVDCRWRDDWIFTR